MNDELKTFLKALDPNVEFIRSKEYQKDSVICDLRYVLIRLDQLIRIDGADILTTQDVTWLEEEKAKLEALWEVAKNAKR